MTRLLNDDTIYAGPERRQHQSKEVSTTLGVLVPIVGLAFAVLVQFGGSMWWGATVSADIRYLSESVNHLQQGRYTRDDARADQALMDGKISAIRSEIAAAVSERNEKINTLQARDVELTRRLEILERGKH